MLDAYFLSFWTSVHCISVAFLFNRQESQQQVCSCPVDREELVHQTVSGLGFFNYYFSSLINDVYKRISLVAHLKAMIHHKIIFSTCSVILTDSTQCITDSLCAPSARTEEK